MAREDLHFRLRIPEELKARVERAARDNHRSMTAEIVATLEEKYPAPAERAFMDEVIDLVLADGVSRTVDRGGHLVSVSRDQTGRIVLQVLDSHTIRDVD